MQKSDTDIHWPDRAFLRELSDYMTGKITKARALICTAVQMKQMINWPALNQSQWSNFLSHKIIMITTYMYNL